MLSSMDLLKSNLIKCQSSITDYVCQKMKSKGPFPMLMGVLGILCYPYICIDKSMPGNVVNIQPVVFYFPGPFLIP